MSLRTSAAFLLALILSMACVNAHAHDPESAIGSRRLLVVTEPGSENAQVLIQAIGRHMGMSSVDIQVLPWARAYRKVQKNIQAMLFPTTRTPEREDKFQWVGPIMSIKWILYGRKGGTVRPGTLEEAMSVGRIGTYRGDARELFLKKKGFTNLDTADNQSMNIRNLVKGRVDLATGSSTSEVDLSVVEPVLIFREVDLYLAFSLSTPPQVVDKWREGLKSFITSGAMARFCCKRGSCIPEVLAQCPEGR